MDIIYAQESIPETMTKALYLAGPIAYDPHGHNWRKEALTFLEEKQYDGIVYYPIARNENPPEDWTAHIQWEQQAIQRSDIIVFWIPESLSSIPQNFLIGIEFGKYLPGRNIIVGCTQKTVANEIFKYFADQNNIFVFPTLTESLVKAIEQIGKGAERKGGETKVPLHLWKQDHFQNWLKAQKRAGNRLDDVFSIALQFWVNPTLPLYWGMHVNLFITAENRHKSNEIVVSRPDIKHVVAYYRPNDKNFWNIEVVLIREFRSTATTSDGFIREIPGGSSYKEKSAKQTAVEEFQKETGMQIEVERLVPLSPRQVAGTTTAHKAYIFALELTEKEIADIKQQRGKRFGNENETEQTYPEVYTVKDLLEIPYTDWSNLGMLFMALYNTEKDSHLNNV